MLGRGAMPANYTANDPEAYERMMGRWSRKLAPQFVAFAELHNPPMILDVGCGTGNLTATLASRFPDANVTGLDQSADFIASATSRDPENARLTFEEGEATALPFADQTFDATLSLLVLNFIPDADRAVREMVRVTKPGGTVAASVWDYPGGFTFVRIFADTAAVLDPSGEEYRAKQFSARFTGADEFAAEWSRLGLRDVMQTTLMIRMEFESFDDYWRPWLGGQGPVGAYVTSLSQDKRTRLEHHLRLAYLGGRPDGRRSFTAAAWAVRGTKSME
ncbi:MAG TPA: class I SAM-dependent methyltransferase [Bradyrhizobium sp.]|nr:class I SAM-dependent methyltransferase [Bradyrhizobium sp.]